MYICNMKSKLLYLLALIICVGVLPQLIKLTDTSTSISYVFGVLIFLVVMVQINNRNRSTGNV